MLEARTAPVPIVLVAVMVCAVAALPGQGCEADRGGRGESSPHRAAACQVVVTHAASFEPRGTGISGDEALRLARAMARAARHDPAAFEARCRGAVGAESGRERKGVSWSILGVVYLGQLAEGFQPLEEALFSLRPGEVSAPVETLAGWHVLLRTPVEEFNAAHILIRHRESIDPPGRAPLPPASRSRDEAHRLAREVRAELEGREMVAFFELARSRSEGLDRVRGGRLGVFPAGRLPGALEAAVRKTPIGGLAGPVETVYGVHVLRRLPVEQVLVRELRFTTRPALAGEDRPWPVEPAALREWMIALRDRIERGPVPVPEDLAASRLVAPGPERRFVALERRYWEGHGAPPPRGRVVPLARRQLPEAIGRVVFALDPGQISGPLALGTESLSLLLRVE